MSSIAKRRIAMISITNNKNSNNKTSIHDYNNNNNKMNVNNKNNNNHQIDVNNKNNNNNENVHLQIRIAIIRPTLTSTILKQ